MKNEFELLCSRPIEGQMKNEFELLYSRPIERQMSFDDLNFGYGTVAIEERPGVQKWDCLEINPTDDELKERGFGSKERASL